MEELLVFQSTYRYLNRIGTMRKRRWEGGGRGKVGENSGEREEDVGMNRKGCWKWEEK